MASEDYREKCFRYKDRECAVCGATENIDVHHIDGDHPTCPVCNDE